MRISSKEGMTALIHPPSIFDDSSGGEARSKLYFRLRKLFHFRNELLLFDIIHTVFFVLAIYGSPKTSPKFQAIFKLLHPKTIEGCFSKKDKDSVPPKPKNEKGGWNLSGHPKRLITVDETFLKQSASATGMSIDNFLETRILQPFTDTSILLTNQLFKTNKLLSEVFPNIIISRGMSESGAQKSGLIERKSAFSPLENVVILTGSNLHICNPLYKSAKEICTHPLHYNFIQSSLDEYLIPRTVYQQRKSNEEIYNQDKLCDSFRICLPAQIDPGSERCLKPSIIPPTWSHINGILSFKTEHIISDIQLCGTLSSIIFDYFIKSSGKSNFHKNVLLALPIPSKIDNYLSQELIARVVALNAMNSSYSLLLELLYKELLNRNFIKKEDYENIFQWLNSKGISEENGWKTCRGLKGSYIQGNDLSRAKALAEIDVLTAHLFSIPMNLFFDIYEEGFQISQSYDQNTFYDLKGQIVFTNNRGLQGVGLPKKGKKSNFKEIFGWEDIKDKKSGNYYHDIEQLNFVSGSEKVRIEYKAPFRLFKRKSHYKTFWTNLENKLRE